MVKFKVKPLYPIKKKRFYQNLDFWSEFLIKATSLFLMISLNWFGLSAIEFTVSSFSAKAEIKNSLITAGTLSFDLEIINIFYNLDKETNQTVKTIDVIKTGTTDFEYSIKTDNVSADFCNFLELSAKRNGQEIDYSEQLKYFNYDAGEYLDDDSWEFFLNLDDYESNYSATCSFDLIFNGSQIGKVGFWHQEIETNEINFWGGSDDNNICLKGYGYWKNNSNIYNNYLPILLGDENITESDAQDLFDSTPTGPDRHALLLKQQLLAMKFNIIHFDIADYFIESKQKKLSDIAESADDLLKSENAKNKDLENMKDLIDQLLNRYDNNCQLNSLLFAEKIEHTLVKLEKIELDENIIFLDGDENNGYENKEIIENESEQKSNTTKNKADEKENIESEIDLNKELEKSVENEGGDYDESQELELVAFDELESERLFTEIEESKKESVENIENEKDKIIIFLNDSKIDKDSDFLPLSTNSLEIKESEVVGIIEKEETIVKKETEKTPQENEQTSDNQIESNEQ